MGCTSYKNQQKCVNAIFDCKWEFSCPGFCSGGSMCNYNDKAKCVNAIFDCKWNCEATPMAAPGVYGGGGAMQMQPQMGYGAPGSMPAQWGAQPQPQHPTW